MKISNQSKTGFRGYISGGSGGTHYSAPLKNYGIRGNAYNLINSYLSNRSQYTVILGEESNKLPITFGVPQGSVLGPLLFILYINDICNATKLGNFVLFADDTNIFVIAKSKTEAYHKAKQVLSCLSNYMKCNKLHINIKKCCYMYFNPCKRAKNVSDMETYSLSIDNIVINQVTETKFLGVIIDDKLSWNPHIKQLATKLRSCTGRLYRIKDLIPERLHKDIYHTLFESHLAFGISVWGGVSFNKLEPIFITQKKCVRILFGDYEAYADKFKTCARCRPYGNQKLGSEFYSREHSKPLFINEDILTVQNLYRYHTIFDLYKILKLRIPISLYLLFHRSQRKETLLITPNPSINFTYKASHMWNSFCQILGVQNFDVSIASFKRTLKRSLLSSQQRYDFEEWCDLNYMQF